LVNFCPISLRADDLAISLDQPAVSLVWKKHLRQSGHYQRIHQPDENFDHQRQQACTLTRRTP
jgi:hypothetical protein